jgi:hypothetical protein
MVGVPIGIAAPAPGATLCESAGTGGGIAAPAPGVTVPGTITGTIVIAMPEPGFTAPGVMIEGITGILDPAPAGFGCWLIVPGIAAPAPSAGALLRTGVMLGSADPPAKAPVFSVASRDGAIGLAAPAVKTVISPVASTLIISVPDAPAANAWSAPATSTVEVEVVAAPAAMTEGCWLIPPGIAAPAAIGLRDARTMGTPPRSAAPGNMARIGSGGRYV